ncbi:MAG: bifunctional folylpolyglutamate synthase/dihydrofolate synthase [Oscillospiraceae bacterium]
MTYDEALEYIHSINWRGSKRGLSRTVALLQKLGSPEKKLKFVHVAGTNGKGSTCACIESILRRAGYKTGLYTSPFITRFNERIKVGGRDITDGELAELVERIKPFAEAEEDKPTEFEIITALGFMFFAEQECDVVILEVGLGGELDSTNVIPTPEAAVITALGLDHTQYLGPDITDIAKAKAGIIKPHGDVVIYQAEPAAEEVIRRKCQQVGANLYRADFSKLQLLEHDLTGCTFDFGHFKSLRIPLAGTYQPYNAAVAITAAELLREKGWNISDEAIIDGINSVKWPGRFELLRRDPVVMLDGAHNPHGIAATAKSLSEDFPGKKIVFLTGVMADKDIANMYPLIGPLADCFITVTPNNPRSLPAEDYAALLNCAGFEAHAAASIEDGVRMAEMRAGRDGVVCALGSLYFSQDVREAVEKIKY